MSGVLSTLTPRGDRTLAPSRIQADARPDPGLLETVAAGFRTTYDEIGDVQENRLDDAYLPVVQALAERNNKRALDYRPSLGTQLINPFDGRVFDQEKIWKDIQAARAEDPDAFAELGKTRAEFEKGVLRRGEGRDRDLDTLARGNAVAGFIGALPAAFRDPFNLATLPIGGVGKTVAGRVLSEGLVNTGIEALQTPAYVGNRSALGEETSAGQVALNLGTAFVGGAAIRGTIEAGKIGLDKAMPGYRASREVRGIELREVDGRDLVRAYDEAMPAEYRTPAEQAALDVMRRAIEIEDASPYPRTHSADAVHERKLEEAASDLAMPRPGGGPGFRKPQQSSTIRFVIDDLEGGGELVRDSGGLTRWGISEKGNPGVDIANLTRGAAEAIYRRKYWIPELAGLPQDAAIVAFDASVNHGPGFARRLIDASQGDAGKMLELRRAEYARLVEQDPAEYARYKDGWENRLQKLEGRLGREPGSAVSDFTVDDLAPQPRPEALDAERPIVALNGQQIPIEPFRAADIGVDAELMQFKSGGDAFGVTERLRGVTEWNPMAAGVVTVWESADGRRLIADGHQRLGLARRLMEQDPSQDIRVNAYVLRESEGFTAQDARIMTALKNISEESGTRADAAKLFREAGEVAEEALAKQLPPKSPLVRDGKALSRLHDEAFGAIINEVIPEPYGAAIGHLVEDPDKHMAMVELLAQLSPGSRAEAEGILRQALAAGFTRETQEELFGGRELVSAIFAHKARVTEKVLAEVKKMKSAFQVAARNADALEVAGNKIARSESEAAAKANSEALALISRLAYRTDNEVSRILTDAAKRLAEGEPLARVVKDAIAQIQGVDLAAAVRAAAEPGAGPGGSGRGGLAESEAGSLRGDERLEDLAPATRDELEAAGQLGFLDTGNNHAAFDDPHGQGVAAAADSMRHDIEAEAPAPARKIPQYEIDAQAGRPASPVDAAADIDTILQHANVNQAELAAFGRELEADGAQWHDPGPKRAARIIEKVEGEGYAGAHELKDIARGAISIERPEQADQILAALRDRFPDVFDKGWQLIPGSGYFDRKLIVTFEGGGRAELQIASQGLWDAKKAGGQDLYDKSRTLPDGDPEKLALDAQQRELYAAALAGTEFAGMASRLAAGKSSASSASLTGTPSTDALPASAGASRQAPSSPSAQASAPATATSRSSISNNANFMGDPLVRDAGGDPAGTANMRQNSDFVNVKGQDADPAVADRQRQEMELRAAAPMRGANRTGQAQDGTMGLGLFDEADAPTFDLGDGQGPRSAADIFRELDDEAADIETIKACGLPGMGKAA